MERFRYLITADTESRSTHDAYTALFEVLRDMYVVDTREQILLDLYSLSQGCPKLACDILRRYARDYWKPRLQR
jgi:hypothetical protein